MYIYSVAAANHACDWCGAGAGGSSADSAAGPLSEAAVGGGSGSGSDGASGGVSEAGSSGGDALSDVVEREEPSAAVSNRLTVVRTVLDLMLAGLLLAGLW